MAFSIVGLNRQGVNVVKCFAELQIENNYGTSVGENQVNAVMIDYRYYIPNFLAEKNPQVP